MAILAVDAGTSAVKAAVFGTAEYPAATVATTVRQPAPGYREQDMVETWHAVLAAGRQAVAAAAEPVDAVAITAQGDGCWLVDERRRPVGPAVLWNDGRAAALVEAWRTDGTLAAAFARNGCTTFPGLLNAILRWLAEYQPDRLAAASAALTCNGWLFAQLTGRVAAEVSDASAPFGGPDGYDGRLVELFGLGEFARLLPATGSNVEPLRNDAADALGVPAGLPVVMAPYDVPATALGLGVTEPGQAGCVLGTTICTMAPVTSRPATGAGLTLATGTAGRYLRAFPTLAGGEAIGWAAGLLGLAGPAELEALAATAPDGAGGLVLLPYLSPAGERAPFLDPAARGTLYGLSFEHGRAELARAVFESLAAVVADCLAATGRDHRQVRVCGGGAASELWCRLIADRTGATVLRAASGTVSARGAATFAATTLGLPSPPEPDFTRREPASGTPTLPLFQALRGHAVPAWHTLAGESDG
jgi:sugar (pentulose or hexulose) kinase